MDMLIMIGTIVSILIIVIFMYWDSIKPHITNGI